MAATDKPQVKLGDWLDTGLPLVQISDASGAGIELVQDDITGALDVIDTVHQEVHEGSSFSAGYMSPHSSLIADDGAITVSFLTNSTRTAHVIFSGAAGGDAEWYLYEGAVISGGTPVTPRNLKRTSSTASTVTVKHSVTFNGTGTLLYSTFNPGGTKNDSAGGTIRAGTEWILKQSTQYLARGVNVAGSAKQMTISGEWYEE